MIMTFSIGMPGQASRARVTQAGEGKNVISMLVPFRSL